MSNSKKNGIFIPTEIYHTDQLTWTEKLIFVEIRNLYFIKNNCFATNKHFAIMLKKSTNTVSKAISRLRDIRLIKAEMIGPRRKLIPLNIENSLIAQDAFPYQELVTNINSYSRKNSASSSQKTVNPIHSNTLSSSQKTVKGGHRFRSSKFTENCEHKETSYKETSLISFPNGKQSAQKKARTFLNSNQFLKNSPIINRIIKEWNHLAKNTEHMIFVSNPYCKYMIKTTSLLENKIITKYGLKIILMSIALFSKQQIYNFKVKVNFGRFFGVGVFGNNPSWFNRMLEKGVIDKFPAMTSIIKEEWGKRIFGNTKNTFSLLEEEKIIAASSRLMGLLRNGVFDKLSQRNEYSYVSFLFDALITRYGSAKLTPGFLCSDTTFDKVVPQYLYERNKVLGIGIITKVKYERLEDIK